MQNLFWRRVAITLVLLISPLLRAAEPAPAIGPGARIIFVGDSITGQGMRQTSGWIYRVGDALKAAYPGARPTVISLGASGISLSGWLHMASVDVPKQDRTCDIKEFFVGKELDQPADAIVILLGANDVAAPYVYDTEKDLSKWEKDYVDLIAFLKTRNHPKVIAVATLLPVTEDPQSAKNALVDKMNAIVAKLAREETLPLVPSNRVMWDVLRQARQRRPDGHVVADSVHPSGAVGHAALAMAVCQGLGFDAAAKQIEANSLKEALNKLELPRPNVSWTITTAPAKEAGPLDQTIKIACHYNPAQGAGEGPIEMRLKAPEGWQVSPEALAGGSGEFVMTPKSFGLYNAMEILVSQGGKPVATQPIRLPAPWRICDGFTSKRPWGFAGPGFGTRASPNAPDERIAAGDGVGKILLDDGAEPTWRYFLPSADYSAGAVSGSTDFFSIANPRPYAAGYALRYLYSDKARNVRLEISSHTFAGHDDLTVWLNKVPCYSDVITRAPKKEATAPAHLEKGWNTLWVKTSHTTFQWQQIVELKPADEGDTLEDVRVSLTRPEENGTGKAGK